MTRRQAFLGMTAFTGVARTLRAYAQDTVSLVRVPANGLQPQLAVGSDGTVHILFYSGDPRGGNLYYSKAPSNSMSFSTPLRVNSQAGSAIAAGTIRGGQIALGARNRVHVAWNGSSLAQPLGPMNPDSEKPGTPMLYSHLNDEGNAFEPQQNLMFESFGLDGGGSIAADLDGSIYVGWHGIGLVEAKDTLKQGEARRRVWIAKSRDNGKSFARETSAWNGETGACGCCGMKLYADSKGNVFALYRSATESVHRDIYLLHSSNRGRSFDGRLLHKWEINACPMSSMDFAENAGHVVAAWETGGQVYWAPLTRTGDIPSQVVSAPADGKGRKHPRIAVSNNGEEVLLVWAEGTGWQKGGSFAWQRYDLSGKAIGERRQELGIPAWSFAAVAAKPEGGFTVLY